MSVEKYLDQLMAIVIDYAPKVLSALIVLFIGLWVIKRVAILSARTMERRSLDVSLRTFLRSLISIGLKVVLIVTVAGMIGIGTASFVTILGAAGLAVGLALQGSLSNFAGGVLILIFKPYKVGDSIEVQGQVGEVQEIQIFNTILLTSAQKTVILPNGAVSNGIIVNNSKMGYLRIDMQVTVSVSNDSDKVIQIIEDTLRQAAHIRETPAPSVTLSQIADGGMTFFIRPFVDTGYQSKVQSQFQLDLKKAFEANQIASPTPTRIIL